MSIRLKITQCILYFALTGLFLNFPLLSVNAQAADAIFLRPTNGQGKPYRQQGTIVNVTGESLVFQNSAGREITYPHKRIERFETTWPAGFTQGKAKAANGAFQEALRMMNLANRNEKRTWARRIILTDMVQMHHALQQDEQAGDLALALLKSDPAGSLTNLPIAWFPTSSVSKTKATEWMRQKSLAAVLLGVSYLLSTDQRTNAIQKLRTTASLTKDPRVLALAESLFWRSQLATVKREDVTRWQSRLKKMPREDRAGAYFILAEAYSATDQPDAAALAYARIPILYKTNRPLVARALLQAGKVTVTTGHKDEAKTFLRELIREYSESEDKLEAELLLKKL